MKFRQNFIKIGSKNDDFDQDLAKFADISVKNVKKFDEFLLKIWIWGGAKECESCRSWKILQNEYLVVKIGFDTAENEPSKVSRKWGVQTGSARGHLSGATARVAHNAVRQHFQSQIFYRGTLSFPCFGKLWRARSPLYQRRFLQPNTHFAAFSEIYKICNPLRRSDLKNSRKFRQTFFVFLLKFLQQS